MSEKESDSIKFFKNLHREIQKQNQALENINSNLRHEGIQEITGAKDDRGSLEKQFTKNPGGVGAFGPVDDFISHSLEISKQLDLYIQEYSLEWSIEQQKAEDVRRAERKAMWLLWAQRMCRWTLGAVAVVLIYSSMVWVSGKWEFVKIPVRDVVVPKHG